MNKIIKAILIIRILLAFPLTGTGAESVDFESIVQKAEAGDPYYQGMLGAIYRRGETGEIDYKKAYKWLKLSSDRGNPIGMYNLAILYESGIAVPKDTVRANELYRKAYLPMYELAQKGNPRAQINLGYLLEIGIGVKEDLHRAIQWYEKAANEGYPRAQYIVGYKYYYGWGYDQDFHKAIEWFTKSAENNYPPAQHFLGNMYSNGRGVPASYSEAVTYFRKAEKFQNNKEIIDTDSGLYILNGISYDGDQIIPGLLPPQFILDIPEGSCGESCLWSILNSDSFRISQIEINHEGGYPGRGLRTVELSRPLKKFDIEFMDKIKKSYFKYVTAFLNPIKLFTSQSERYRRFLYNEVIEKIKQGYPIILGVKIYPDNHFFWDCDHFILLVGYNETTNEIIFNDFTSRKRINAEKLLDKTDGYSIINRYRFLNYIKIVKFNER